MLGYLTEEGVNLLVLGISLAMLAAAAVAFVDCLLRRPDAFAAAGKLTKGKWSAILGVAVVLLLAFGNHPISLPCLIAIVASLIYLLDVRPALRQIGGGSSGGGGYGGW